MEKFNLFLCICTALVALRWPVQGLESRLKRQSSMMGGDLGIPSEATAVDASSDKIKEIVEKAQEQIKEDLEDKPPVVKAETVFDKKKAEKAITEAKKIAKDITHEDTKAQADKLVDDRKRRELEEAVADGKTAVAKAQLAEEKRLEIGGETEPAAGGASSTLASTRPDFLRSIHTDMLPSVVHVVTHEANYGEFNPKLRPMCSKIVEEIEQSQVKNRESRSFGAFEAAIHLLGGFEDRVPDLGDDKIINYCIDIIKSYVFGPQSLDWNYVASLRNCAVDKMGRTIFMKLVERGMVKSILNQGSKRLYGIQLSKLRDTDNNTCLHLAVMSQNKYIAETILGRLGGDKIASMLEQRNIHGERPVDMAVRLRLADLEAVLRQHYSTFAPLAKMAIRRRHQSPDNLKRSGSTPSVRSQILAEAA